MGRHTNLKSPIPGPDTQFQTRHKLETLPPTRCGLFKYFAESNETGHADGPLYPDDSESVLFL